MKTERDILIEIAILENAISKLQGELNSLEFEHLSDGYYIGGLTMPKSSKTQAEIEEEIESIKSQIKALKWVID
jgi:hypothetical protein